MIEQIRTALEQIIDPSLKQTLKDTGGIKHIGYDNEKDVVVLIIAMGRKGGENEKKLRKEIAKLIKIDLQHRGLKLEIEEHRVVNSITHSKTVFIGIASGKGGVGKSTVTANIAYRLMKKGYNVGVMDADIYGSSIPQLLEIPHQNPKASEDKKILPLAKDNMEVISTEFFTNPNQPVIWRGAMLNSMLSYFFYEVKWNKKTDFMLIDMPPGTGDIALNIHSFAPQTQMIIVTTPHPSAANVAIKAGVAAQQMKHDLLGVIENMSYYQNPATQQPEYLFGKGGGEMVANSLQTELIASIPINQPLHHTALYDLDEEIGRIYDMIADYIIIKTLSE